MSFSILWRLIEMERYEKVFYDKKLPIKLYDFFTEKNEGEIIEKHWHNSLEILIPLYGGFDLWIDGLIYNIKAGEVFIVNSRNIHAIRGNESEKIYKGYALQISQEYLKECCIEIERYYFEQPAAEVNKILMKILIEIIRFYEDDDEYNDIRIKSYVQMIIFILLDKLAIEDDSCLMPKEGKYKKRITKIIKYIETNYQEDLTVSQIADTFKISSGYLTKLFKDSLDLTVKEFINEIRLKHAKEELLKTNYAIIDIAIENGFPNIKSFNHTFKKKNNMTPAKYRSMMKG